MIPGSQQYSDATGATTDYLGINTIVRNGDLINFDIFVEGDVGYLRFEGNCRNSTIRIIRASDALPSATYSPTNANNGESLRYACLRSEPGTNQTFPAITSGMRYAEARQLLLNSGWQASYFSNADREAATGIILLPHAEHIINNLGFQELEFCSPFGMGLCHFVFTDSNGRSLTVETSNNECLNPNVRECESVVPFIVNDWSIE
jgi:hypothetical protein